MNNRNLYIQLYSIHGLFRGSNLEIGRDADTGGQTKYVFQLASTLSEHPAVEKVELVTRLIRDRKLSSDYSVPVEKINDKFDIIRIGCGGGRYIRKELLWPHLEEFIDKSIKYLKSKSKLPDFVHSHYPDAGYVCSELSGFFGIPLIHTAHSFGKSKLKKLLASGYNHEEIDKKYKIDHRIDVEESIAYGADLIITSTKFEKKEEYSDYPNISESKIKVIPPGIDLDKFIPYTSKKARGEEMNELIRKIGAELLNFFVQMDKPLILSLCRPDRKKNITGLIRAFGESKELQKKANLAIYAGIREDIQSMDDNEREVLTEILLLMDKYNLYGKMAIPKRHDTEEEVPELYRIAAELNGVFTNVAISETFGLTLIEAAASGVPVVATNHGGPEDIIANCKNGILVDVSDTKNISGAIDNILSDKDLWKQYSENGIINVRKYYTWQAHTEKYLEEIDSLLDQQPAEKLNTFAETGRKLFNMEKMIVSDIDYTLIGNDDLLNDFINILNTVPNDIGFAVATGRSVDSAIDVLKENNVPLPEVIISSVGSEIYYNYKGKQIYSKGWDAHISHKWKRDRIVELLSGFDFLQLQEEHSQRKFKISYYTSDNPEYIIEIKNLLMENKIQANIIFSHGQYLDILPYRASKGKAIRYLAYRWNLSYENILVAGDSGNDREMLKGELLGVVVANHSPELENLKGQKKIYFSSREFAGGLIDGIQHYNFLSN
jgi:sucrose-phosphate synthase